MKRAILRGLLAMLVLLLVVYVGDYCALRYQIPRGRPQFGQITVDTLYAIRQKNGKTEYELGEPGDRTLCPFAVSALRLQPLLVCRPPHRKTHQYLIMRFDYAI